MEGNHVKKSSIINTTYAGIPLYLWVLLTVITLVGMATGSMGTDFGATLFWLSIIGAVIMGIGNKLPIIRDYLGGGPLLVLLFGSWLTWKGLIPEIYVTAANDWMSTFNFQAFFLTLLIVGSVMQIDRKTLLRSLVGYLPCIAGGLIGAFLMAALTGKFLGISVGDILMKYVMPIMGGGSAAGALPMSSIYQEVTGGDKEAYYGVAMSALMVANILCIFFAVGLNAIGKIWPKLTGDGRQLMRKNVGESENKQEDCLYDLRDVGNGLWIMVSCWVIAGIFSKWLLPRICGVSIHQYAYLVIFAVLMNVTNSIPGRIKKGMGVLFKWMNYGLAPAVFAGMSISLLNFQSFIDALSFTTLCMSIAVIIGCIIGSALLGYLVGYYPIDAAMTGGLCMANMGGSGDMLILTAGNRMELMTYASISSRIGGALVLEISGIVFGIFG